MRGRVLVAVLAVAVALTGAGCTAAEPGAGGGQVTESKTPNKRPDEQLRKSLAAGLTEAGATQEASVVTRGGSRVTRLEAGYLGNWAVYQVDYSQGAHPVRFHAASDGHEAIMLTGEPKAFNRMTGKAEPSVNTPQLAAGIARLYVQTTRDADVLTYVVSGVNEIKFNPKLAGSAAQRRDAIKAEYGPVVKPPAAVADGDDFVATVFVVRDKELQRRTITVSAEGEVKEKTKTLVPDLPTPIVL